MNAGGRFVEIKFIRQDGTEADPCQENQNECIPVMDIFVFPPGGKGDHYIHGVGMVDTGCDGLCVAAAVLDQISNVHVRDMTLHGATGAAELAPMRDCTLLIPLNDGTLFKVNADAIRSVGTDRHVYMALIGRSILKLGCLVMDYPNRIFRFYIAS